jgi:hypothetical protein
MSRDSGQTKCGTTSCNWKFGRHIDSIKMEWPVRAPMEGVSDKWLCSLCFDRAAKAATARDIILRKVGRVSRAKEEGIVLCQNLNCKRLLGRNKLNGERLAERPR